MKTGIELIAKERKRQVEVEGWDAKHDKQHWEGSLAKAAACYALGDRKLSRQFGNDANRIDINFDFWPWDDKWWKPESIITTEGRIRNLIKAGALIAAEIDRLQAWDE